jgi:hypothetical protein
VDGGLFVLAEATGLGERIKLFPTAAAGAKQEWALETGIANDVLCTENDIRNYIKLDSKGNLPKCPQGGINTIGEIGEPPTCSLGKTSRAHVLP